MPIEPRRDPVRGTIFTAMIIQAAMIIGLLLFLAVALVLSDKCGSTGANEPRMPVLSYTAAASGAIAVFLVLVLPPALDGAARRALAARMGSGGLHGREGAGAPGERPAETPSGGPAQGSAWAARLRAAGPLGEEEFLARAYLTRTIILAALLEGAAIFCGVAFMLEGRPLAVAAMGVLVLGMALMFPTSDRARRWIQRQGRGIGRGM